MNEICNILLKIYYTVNNYLVTQFKYTVNIFIHISLYLILKQKNKCI